MGYYSELAIEETDREDYSYLSPKLQLIWRIEDLKKRLKEIIAGECGIITCYYKGCQYSKDDLAYALPEYFSKESDIIAAIDIAEKRLTIIEKEEEKIHARGISDDSKVIEEISGQMAIRDFPQPQATRPCNSKNKQAA